MHIILTGATGLVGSAALAALAGMKEITKISILSRRPVPMAQAMKDDRIDVIVQENFGNYDTDLLKRLKGANGCVWALGISQSAVSKDEYIRITKSLTMDAAEAFQGIKTESGTFNFVFVSGEGATRKPGVATPLFGRVKGETERALIDLGKENPHFRPIIVRPAFVDPKGHKEIEQWIPAATGLRRVEGVASAVLRTLWPSYVSPTKPLGAFLAGLAAGQWDGGLRGDGVDVSDDVVTVNNLGFRRLMGL